MDLQGITKELTEAYRNLSPEQRRLVESDTPLTSPQMQYARRVYRKYVDAEATYRAMLSKNTRTCA